jgi:hypothetical protein
MKKIIYISLLVVALTSCSSNVDLAIDNPTDNSIIIKIDTLSVEIPPKEVVWVEMGPGEHQITLENDSIVKYNFDKEVYMINPTFSEYLKYEEYYGDEMSSMSFKSSIPEGKVAFYGLELEGPYQVIKGLINAVDWDYGPREALPEMVEMDADENFTTLMKIYDFKEFFSLVNQESTNSGE